MSARRLSDAALLASIAASTAFWGGAQDTQYYAEKHGYDHDAMHARLLALALAGQVERTQRQRWGNKADDLWSVAPPV